MAILLNLVKSIAEAIHAFFQIISVNIPHSHMSISPIIYRQYHFINLSHSAHVNRLHYIREFSVQNSYIITF